MVDLLARMLDSMREPAFDMIGLRGIDEAKVIPPDGCVRRVARNGVRLPVKVDHVYAGLRHPSTVGNDAVLDDKRFVRMPRHLYRSSVEVELLARSPAQPGTNRSRRPQVARGKIQILGLRQYR